VVTLKYKDEKDRAYGLGGMTVCMCMLENEQFIDNVSLDAEPDEGLVFTPDFFHASNQQLSAKSVWKDNLDHFQLMASMMVSNVLSRALVRYHEDISRELSDLIINRLIEEGKEVCTLDDDEVKDIYYKTYSFFHRVFSHSEVSRVMEGFVEELVKKRQIDNERIRYCLRPLMGR